MEDRIKVGEVEDIKPPIKAPEVPEHERLAQAMQMEKQARARRVMAHIEEYCKQNNCLLAAIPQFEAIPGGGWVIKAVPGVNPL